MSSRSTVLRPLACLAALALATIPAPALAAKKKDPPKVVADLPVIASLVEQVMGDLGDPVTLIEPGSDPHHHALRPSQAGSLQEADLLIWVGPQLTPWLQRTATTRGEDATLTLIAVPDTYLRDYDGRTDEHGNSNAMTTDPHAWLDPANARLWASAIAESLTRQDPDNAAIYRGNAERLATSIEMVDASARKRLAPVSDRPFAVLHDGYGYFVNSYKIGPALPLSLGDGAAPSAARIAELKGRIGAEGITCAFPEAGHDPAALNPAIEGTGARLGAPLDPAGTGLEPGPDLYQRVIRGMARAISDCLAHR